LSQTTITRRPHAARTRSVLAVFVVAWMNLVLQPCAMALGGVEQHDCPRCPDSASADHAAHEMAGHDMVGHEMAGHDMAGHDMAMGDMPCASAATDCSLADELNYDSRNTELKPKDSPQDLPIAVLPAIATVPALRPADYAGWHRTRSPPPGSSTPLNITYCVFLI
jgi:hypothetical protein